MPSRLVSVLLVPATLLVTPASALARVAPEAPSVDEASSVGEAESADEAPSEEDQALDRAQTLFDSGADKFDTADYAGAIADWTEAYGLVPSLPEYGSIKAKLIANIASAQEKAYEVDGETTHLNQAKILLERYRDELADIYTTTAERDKELAWANERIERIQAELDALAEAEAKAKADAEARRNAAIAASQEKPRGGPFIITGSTFLALGVAGFGVMGGGLALGSGAEDISDLPTNELEARGERYAQGRLGNTLAYVGAIAGGVSLITGAALLAIGLKQRKQGHESKPDFSVAPTFERGGVGLGVVGRF